MTGRQHKVKLQFLGTALLNIATNKHTKFQVIPPKDDKVLLWTSKKCYENEGQMGKNNSKFVLGSYGSCAMLSIIFQQSCIIFKQMPSFKLIRLEMTKFCSGLRTIPTNFLIQGQITPLVLVRLHP